MPELPEVETVKRQLSKSLIGKRIKGVFIYTDKMVARGAVKISNIKKGSKQGSARFAATLAGKRIVALDRRAKFLLIKLSGGYNLMIHLRMSGQLIFLDAQAQKKPLLLSLAKTAISQLLPTRHTHAEFLFTDGGKLFYNDTRQFGHIRLASDAELAEVLRNANLGPEPLEIKRAAFADLIAAHANKRAKDFLLNQQIIAGIGNIYADESLFAARIDPLRKVGTLKPAEITRLHAAIGAILAKAIRFGGSSIESFLMTNGTAGKYSDEHLVYAKEGEPCPNCGRPLRSQKIGSRTSTFCAHCQK